MWQLDAPTDTSSNCRSGLRVKFERAFSLIRFRDAYLIDGIEWQLMNGANNVLTNRLEFLNRQELYNLGQGYVPLCSALGDDGFTEVAIRLSVWNVDTDGRLSLTQEVTYSSMNACALWVLTRIPPGLLTSIPPPGMSACVTG